MPYGAVSYPSWAEYCHRPERQMKRLPCCPARAVEVHLRNGETCGLPIRCQVKWLQCLAIETSARNLEKVHGAALQNDRLVINYRGTHCMVTWQCDWQFVSFPLMKNWKYGCEHGAETVHSGGNNLLIVLVVVFLLVAYALTWLSLPAALSYDDALYCAHDTFWERMEGVYGSWRHWNGRWGELAAHALGSWTPLFYQWTHPLIVLALCWRLYRAALGMWPHQGRRRRAALAWVMILASGMILNNFTWFSANGSWLRPSVALLALCIVSEKAVEGGFRAEVRRARPSWLFCAAWGTSIRTPQAACGSAFSARPPGGVDA